MVFEAPVLWGRAKRKLNFNRNGIECQAMQDYQTIADNHLREYLLASTLEGADSTRAITWIGRKCSRSVLSRILTCEGWGVFAVAVALLVIVGSLMIR